MKNELRWRVRSPISESRVFSVAAWYGWEGDRRRLTRISAPSPERAAVTAVITGKLRVEVLPGSNLRFAPELFHTTNARGEALPQRWPKVVSVESRNDGTTEVMLGFGDENFNAAIVCYVTEESPTRPLRP